MERTARTSWCVSSSCSEGQIEAQQSCSISFEYDHKYVVKDGENKGLAKKEDKIEKMETNKKTRVQQVLFLVFLLLFFLLSLKRHNVLTL